MARRISIQVFLFVVVVLLSFFIVFPWAVAQEMTGGVIQIDGEDIVVDWGSKDGIQEGMHFILYRNKEMVHPATGERINVQRDLVGRIEVHKVDEQYAVGKLIRQVKTPVVGDMVELVIDSGAPLAPPPASEQKDGKVIDVRSGHVAFDLGEQEGVESDLLFDVVRYADSVHPRTGEFLGRKRIELGQIKVIKVENENSIGRIISRGEDVRVGDQVELSNQQLADLELELLGTQQTQGGAGGIQNRYIGEIISIQGNAISVRWYGASRGQVGERLGVYRQETMVHPVTAQIIGEPMVLIAQVLIDEVNGNTAQGTLTNIEAVVSQNDQVGLLSEDVLLAALPGQRPAPAMPVKRRSLATKGAAAEAQSITEQVIRNQRELYALRGMSDKLERIERSIGEQQAVTRHLQRDITLIKERLNALTLKGGQSLIGGGPGIEFLGSDDAEVQTMRFAYTDDVDLQVQVHGKTFLVKMDVDSVKLEDITDAVEDSAGMAMAPQLDEEGDTMINPLLAEEGQEEVSEGGFFSGWVLYAGIGILLLLLGGGGFFFMQKRKSGVAGTSEEADLDEEDEELEEEVDEEEEQLEEIE